MTDIDLRKIIEYATMLEEIDKKNNKSQKLVNKKYNYNKSKEDVLKILEELDIKREYSQKALERFYPERRAIKKIENKFITEKSEEAKKGDYKENLKNLYNDLINNIINNLPLVEIRKSGGRKTPDELGWHREYDKSIIGKGIEFNLDNVNESREGWYLNGNYFHGSLYEIIEPSKIVTKRILFRKKKIIQYSLLSLIKEVPYRWDYRKNAGLTAVIKNPIVLEAIGEIFAKYKPVIKSSILRDY